MQTLIALRDAIEAWLSPARRGALYLALSTAVTSLVTLGAVSESDASVYISLSALVLQALVLVLQLTHMDAVSLGAWFTSTGRATLYSGAVALAVAGQSLGYFTEAAAAPWLTGISVGLTVLGSIVSVLQIGTSQGDLLDSVSGEYAALIADGIVSRGIAAKDAEAAAYAEYADDDEPLSEGIID